MNIAILGAGAWGTALAASWSAAHRVSLWTRAKVDADELAAARESRYLPGVRIPIRDPGEIRRTRPDYVFILPWNLKDEIVEELSFVREWGGRFIVRAPDMTIL